MGSKRDSLPFIESFAALSYILRCTLVEPVEPVEPIEPIEPVEPFIPMRFPVSRTIHKETQKPKE